MNKHISFYLELAAIFAFAMVFQYFDIMKPRDYYTIVTMVTLIQLKHGIGRKD